MLLRVNLLRKLGLLHWHKGLAWVILDFLNGLVIGSLLRIEIAHELLPNKLVIFNRHAIFWNFLRLIYLANPCSRSCSPDAIAVVDLLKYGLARLFLLGKVWAESSFNMTLIVR